MKVLVIIIHLGITILSCQLHAQNIEFYREDIIFKIDGHTAEVNGVYHFCNVGDREIKTRLFYPFPDEAKNLIDTILVMDFEEDSAKLFHESAGGVYFEIYVPAYDQSACRIYYRQKLISNHFTYILKSTNSWQRPLEFANFELQAPAALTVDSLSYYPDTSFTYQDTKIYRWHKKNFMPDKDFEVYFETDD
jgi:hypothetical protein